MDNPILAILDREFARAGLAQAELLNDHFSYEHFGNAVATYRISGLLLRFVRDRGELSVDFVNPRNANEIYMFDDVAILMGWKTIEEMIARANSIDFSKPPQPIPPFSEQLDLIAIHLKALQHLFSAEEFPQTREQLQKVFDDRRHAYMRRTFRRP